MSLAFMALVSGLLTYFSSTTFKCYCLLFRAADPAHLLFHTTMLATTMLANNSKHGCGHYYAHKRLLSQASSEQHAQYCRPVRALTDSPNRAPQSSSRRRSTLSDPVATSHRSSVYTAAHSSNSTCSSTSTALLAAASAAVCALDTGPSSSLLQNRTLVFRTRSALNLARPRPIGLATIDCLGYTSPRVRPATAAPALEHGRRFTLPARSGQGERPGIHAPASAVVNDVAATAALAAEVDAGRQYACQGCDTPDSTRDVTLNAAFDTGATNPTGLSNTTAPLHQQRHHGHPLQAGHLQPQSLDSHRPSNNPTLHVGVPRLPLALMPGTAWQSAPPGAATSRSRLSGGPPLSRSGSAQYDPRVILDTAQTHNSTVAAAAAALRQHNGGVLVLPSSVRRDRSSEPLRVELSARLGGEAENAMQEAEDTMQTATQTAMQEDEGNMHAQEVGDEVQLRLRRKKRDVSDSSESESSASGTASKATGLAGLADLVTGPFAPGHISWCVAWSFTGLWS